MPIEELANILVQMCDNAEQDKEKSVMPHLFGIRYADEIGNRHTEIVIEAKGLRDENFVIIDQRGNLLNDFE